MLSRKRGRLNKKILMFSIQYGSKNTRMKELEEQQHLIRVIEILGKIIE